MSLTHVASIALIVGLVLLPSVIAAFHINGPQESEPEFEYDYR